VGNVYRWRLEGVDGDWEGFAEKYRMVDEPADEMLFCFRLGPVELQACGRFESAIVTDGKVHRETVHLKGDRIWLRQSASSSPAVTGRKSAPTSLSPT